MTNNRTRFDQYKEHADELRLKIREWEYASRYGTKEDADALLAEVNTLRDQLRAFNTELEHYVPDNCPPSVRRRKLQEREFIKYYYIMGLTMDKAAEYMNLSRDTAYRIRTRLTLSK